MKDSEEVGGSFFLKLVQLEIHRAGPSLLTVGNLMHEKATP